MLEKRTMSSTFFSCAVLLVSLLTVLPKGSTEIMPKRVCLDDSVPLFQNISLSNRTNVVSKYLGNSSRQIAGWFTKDSITHSSVEKLYEKTLSVDHYGSIWIAHVRYSDQGKYRLISTDNFSGVVYFQEVELIILVAPNLQCKPQIEFPVEESHLIASVNVNACGKPPVSAYWLGHNKQAVITLNPEKDAKPYHACVQGLSLRCVKLFKANNFCSPFKRGVDEEMQPKISLGTINILNSSITLQCQLNGKSGERFRFRRNGNLITDDNKYAQMESFLIIKHPNIDVTYDIFTCMESGGRLQSDPFNIETFGPSEIQFRNMVTVKEMDTLNVICFTKCSPLCSVTWSRLDPTSGNINILLEKDVLHITNVTRQMSGNYTCKVQNLITGTSVEGVISIDIHYGPERIVFNTSNNIVELHESDSIAILCTAECFPSCIINWSEGNVNNQRGYAVLNLINVSSNGTYTCSASNPGLDTNKLSRNINISVTIDNERPNISSDNDEDRSAAYTDIPFLRYMLHVVPAIGGAVVIIAVVTYLRKKCRLCSCKSQEPNISTNLLSDAGENNQEETPSLTYWTVVTNARGEFSTAIESNNDVELRQFLVPNMNNTSTYHRSFNSDHIEIVTNSSDSIKSEGYINPIHCEIRKSNEYMIPPLSHPIECTGYIHPVHSDTLELEGYIDPITTGYKDSFSIDDPSTLHYEGHDRDITSACSEGVKPNENIDHFFTE